MKHKISRRGSEESLNELENLNVDSSIHPAQTPHILFSAENALHTPKVKMSHDQVLNALRRRGINFEEVQGKYGEPERSIMVLNPTQKQRVFVQNTAQKLGQDSVIHSDGKDHVYMYLNGEKAGKYHKGRDTQFHDSEPMNDYTKMKDGSYFTHNIDFEHLHSDDINKNEINSKPKDIFNRHPREYYKEKRDQEKRKIIAERERKRTGAKKPLDAAMDKLKEMEEKKKNNFDKYEDMSQSEIIDEEDLLEKTKPQYIGENHPSQPWQAKQHSLGDVMWAANNDQAARIDSFIRDRQNHERIMSKLPKTHLQAYKDMVNQVAKDPDRHFIPSQHGLGGEQKVRARHLKALLSGDPSVKIDTSDPSRLTIHRQSHTKGMGQPNISIHFPTKGSDEIGKGNVQQGVARSVPTGQGIEKSESRGSRASVGKNWLGNKPDSRPELAKNHDVGLTLNETADTLMNRMEDKFFLPSSKLQEFAKLASEKLKEGDIDTSVRHNTNRTIYLDNRDLDSFRDNLEGIKPRFKVRIRQYKPNNGEWENIAYLELKVKTQDGMGKKTRVRIYTSMIDDICQGKEIASSKKLENINKDISKTELWQRIVAINTIIEKYGFRKQAVVEYHRRAYSGKSVRISIDDSLRYYSFKPIDRVNGQSILESDKWKKVNKTFKKLKNNDILILEVKHEGKLPDWIKKAIKKMGIKPVSFSKYCAAVISHLTNGHAEEDIVQRQKLTFDSNKIIDILKSEEDLMKGSLQRRNPFNPKSKENEITTSKQRRWTHDEEDDDRQTLPKMKGSARLRALNKLMAQTHVRKDPSTGERLFLMHRGMGTEEFNGSHSNGIAQYEKGVKTSWTPNREVADTFGHQSSKPALSDSSRRNRTVSAWIPESAIVHSVNQFNAPTDAAIENSKFLPKTGKKDIKNSRSITERDENEWIVEHNQPFHHANPSLVDRLNRDKLVSTWTTTSDSTSPDFKGEIGAKQFNATSQLAPEDKDQAYHNALNAKARIGSEDKIKKMPKLKTKLAASENTEPDLNK